MDGDIKKSKKCSFYLVGRAATKGDIIPHVDLPEDTEIGDYLLVENAGVYHSTQGSMYQLKRPHEYVIYEGK